MALAETMAVTAAAAGPGAKAGGGAPPPLLELDRLEVAFPAEGRWVAAVRSVSFTVERGEMLGLVGESGSGKTLTALAILRLLPPPARVGGRILLAGHDLQGEPANLLALSEDEMRRVRGARIGIAFQEPATALDPVYSIGFQLAEAIRAHRQLSRRAALDEAAGLLDRVAIPDARQRLGEYPHQLSGGQRQRVMLAMALASGPELLLADEPTTALDVTLQAQMLRLLERLRAELGLAVVLITHDLAVVAETCDRVVVFYAGQVVEEAPVAALFGSPAHPYSRGLLATLPRLGRPAAPGRLPVLSGQPPDPASLPTGCAFHPRCPERLASTPLCIDRAPPLGPPAADSAPGAWSAPTRAEALAAQEPSAEVGAAPVGERLVRCWLHAPEPERCERPERSDRATRPAGESAG